MLSARIVERYLIEIELEHGITVENAIANFYTTTSRYANKMPIQTASIVGNMVYITLYHMDNNSEYRIFYGSSTVYLPVTYLGINEPTVVLFNKTPEHNTVVEPTTEMTVDVVPQDCYVLPTGVVVKSNDYDITNDCEITSYNDYKWCKVTYSNLQYDSIYKITIDVNGIVGDDE